MARALGAGDRLTTSLAGGPTLATPVPIAGSNSLADQLEMVARMAHRHKKHLPPRAHLGRGPDPHCMILACDDTDASDLDLLVEPTKETTMMDIAKVQWELSQLLPVPVDVLTPNGLPASFRNQVVSEALPV